MVINQKIKKQIVDLLKKSKVIIEPSDLAVPPTQEMGDLAFPCFELAKKQKKAPNEIASELAQKIKPQGLIINLKAIGPYLNFLIDYSQVAELLFKEITKQKNKYGQNKESKGEKVMIEYSQPNTHKEFHVGHLRNLSLGASLINIYQACGAKVIAANYYGDHGAHVAKALWYLQNFVNQTDIPAENRGEFLGKCYVAGNRLLKEKEEYQQQVSELYQKLEKGEPKITKLYQETKKWSLDEFKKIYQEQGAPFEVDYSESQMLEAGKEMIPQLLKKDFIKKSQGAIIADLKKFDLDILVLVRKDGTTLYGIKDIPLNINKFKKFKLDKSLIVVDNRQSLYLKQVFKILELMGFKKEMIHVAYEFVGPKEGGVFASREGNAITYKEVRQAALNKVIQETKERHPDWKDQKIEDTSIKIVVAALKFVMLKSNINKTIQFDLDEALDINGFTGPYVQYTYARLNSILKKHNQALGKIDYQVYGTQIEKELIQDLLTFPQIILEAQKINDPSVCIQYVYKLAQDFNTFYHQLPVLKAEPTVKNARLALLINIQQVLANAMQLVGLPVIDEM